MTVAQGTLLRGSRLSLASGVAGVAWVVVLFGAALLVAPPPGGQASAAQLGDWYAGHHTALLAQVYLRGLAQLLMLVFVGTLVDLVRRAQGELDSLALLAFGGAIGGTLMVLLSNTVIGATALVAAQGSDPGAVRTLHTLYEMLTTLDSFPWALMLGALSVALLRTRLTPRWVAWLGLVAASVQLVYGAGFAGGPMALAGIFGFVLTILWLLATSVTLLRHSRTGRFDPRRQVAFA